MTYCLGRADRVFGHWNVKEPFYKIIVWKKKKKKDPTWNIKNKNIQTMPPNKLIKLALAQLASQLQLIKDVLSYVVSDSKIKKKKFRARSFDLSN